MPTLITLGSELLRINPANNSIEYSTNRGASWLRRASGDSNGVFRDLLMYDGELLACTSKGLCYSQNKGASWLMRFCWNSSCDIITIQDGGRELLGNTRDGHLFYSINKGASWMRRY